MKTTRKIISETTKNGVKKIVTEEGKRSGQKLISTKYHHDGTDAGYIESVRQARKDNPPNPTFEEILEERKQHYRCILHNKGLPTSERVPYEGGESYIDYHVKYLLGFEYETLEEESSRVLMQIINFETSLKQIQSQFGKLNDPQKGLLLDAFLLGQATVKAMWNEDKTGRTTNLGKKSKKKQWAIDLAEMLVETNPKGKFSREYIWNKIVDSQRDINDVPYRSDDDKHLLISFENGETDKITKGVFFKKISTARKKVKKV